MDARALWTATSRQPERQITAHRSELKKTPFFFQVPVAAAADAVRRTALFTSIKTVIDIDSTVHMGCMKGDTYE
jgi:hypothetical protein